jgi:hypothetical protein
MVQTPCPQYLRHVSSFFATTGPSETDTTRPSAAVPNPWKVVLGVLAGVLLLGGVIALTVGLATIGQFPETVEGEPATFDHGAVTAVAGGIAIVLGVVVGTCWLVLGALAHDRRG